ncbi:MAG: T9SS type A sorting domain-containing protein [Ignavibacteria bacterium]|nr:T9SS type A sorting domain-containing protein [Ignavibacteria bacterium]
MKLILLFIILFSFLVKETDAVIPDPNPPVISAPGFVTYYLVCDTVNFEVTVSDIESGPVTLNVTGLHPQITVTPPLPVSGNPVTILLSFVPNPLIEHTTLYYTATDSSGNVSTDYTVIDFPLGILSTPRWHSPATCGATYNLLADDSITIPLFVYDESYDTITLTATGVPDGAVFTPPLPFRGRQLYDGTMKWKPDITQAGFHNIVFTATDYCGQVKTCSINFDVVLPVELSSFVSSVSRNNVILNWTTSSEINNSGFEIERKKTGGLWEIKGAIPGNGNSAEPVNYRFTDKGLVKGNYEYRLKQIDFNGNFEYHDLTEEVIIGQPSDFSLSQNYPNPYNPVTKIDFNIPSDGNVVMKVYDISGKEISTLVNEYREADYYTEFFNASDLASGIYYYKLTFTSGAVRNEKTLKMAVLK